MRRRRARVARPAMWSWCSWVMRMAESAAGSSLGVFMRLSSSRQERPASMSRRVWAEAMTVELPLEPEARTVMRMRLRYAGLMWITGTELVASRVREGLGLLLWLLAGIPPAIPPRSKPSEKEAVEDARYPHWVPGGRVVPRDGKDDD